MRSGPLGTPDQVVGLGQSGRERLLHQQVQAGIQQRQRNRVMLHRGNCNRGCTQACVGVQHLLHAGKDRNPVLRLDRRRAPRIRLHAGGQLHAGARLLQLAINAQMVAPERSGAHYGHTQPGFACDVLYAPLPSTARRQRP